MGQLAQDLIAEGYAEGYAKGLEQLLEQRFGPLPAPVRDRIAGASLDELRAWFRVAIDAPSLDAVFGARVRH